MNAPGAGERDIDLGNCDIADLTGGGFVAREHAEPLEGEILIARP